MIEFYAAISIGCRPKALHKDYQGALQSLKQMGVLDKHKGEIRLKKDFVIGVLEKGHKKTFLIPLVSEYQKDFVLRNAPSKAMKGDIILAKKKYIKQGKRKGVMQHKIIVRFVSLLMQYQQFSICITQEKKGFIYALSLQENTLLQLKASQKSLKALPKNCLLKVDTRSLEVIKVLGVLDDECIDKEICLEQYNISTNFTQEALLLAQSYGTQVFEEQYPNRVDYTHLRFCVIDPKGAKDHDDAIYYDKKAQKLYVAIADVSEYVSKNSALDKEARQRGFSVYFPDSVVPMLPFELSSGLCSLKKDCVRLALVWEINLKDGKMGHFCLNEGIIKVCDMLDYEELDSMLLAKSLSKSLMWLKDYIPQVKKLRLNRLKYGYNFENPEPTMHLDSQGRVINISLTYDSLSHHIIEESMLLANICAAQMLHTLAPNGLYRIHQYPKEQKISKLFCMFQELGAPINDLSNLHTQVTEIQRWAAHKGQEFAQMIDFLMIRSFTKARYSAMPLGHFGLGFPLYTHFTSPIRRYGDICVHRILKSFITNDKNIHYMSSHLEGVAQLLNFKQTIITSLERDFMDIKYVRYILRCLKKAKKPLVCRAALFNNNVLKVCFALDIIPYARILVKFCDKYQNSSESHKLDIVNVRLEGADLIKREIYGVVVSKIL